MKAHEPNPYTSPAEPIPAQARRRLPIPVQLLAYFTALAGVFVAGGALLLVAIVIPSTADRSIPAAPGVPYGIGQALLVAMGGGMFLASAGSQLRDRPDYGLLFAMAGFACLLGSFLVILDWKETY